MFLDLLKIKLNPNFAFKVFKIIELKVVARRVESPSCFSGDAWLAGLLKVFLRMFKKLSPIINAKEF